MSSQIKEATRVDLHRHPIKSGQSVASQTEAGTNNPLPVEGLVQAQEMAATYAKEIEAAPDGTVVWSLTSTAGRTQEARYILDQELRVMAKEYPDEIEIVDLDGGWPDAGTKILADYAVKASGQPKKLVLINGPEDARLGAYDWDADNYVAIAEKIGEGALLSGWQHDTSIAEAVGVNYQQVAQGYHQLADSIAQVSTEVFPDRPIWVKAFGHSGEIEAGLATWSGNTMAQVIEVGGGEGIAPLDAGHMTLTPDGGRQVSYQDQNL